MTASLVKRVLLGVAALLSNACNEPPSKGVGDTWEGPEGTWVEVWRDDFDGAALSAPDPEKWNVEVRPRGHNQELDYDTDRRDNSFLDGSGHLVLKALEEQFVDVNGQVSAQPYTSARLNTRGKLEQAYGKFEARIQLPEGGKGVWPAFWLLGSDFEEIGWPRCGEIDILEMAGSRPHEIKGSLHGPGHSGAESLTRAYLLESGTFGEAFHTFALEWTETGMRWLVDGNVYHVRTPAGLASLNQPWVYDHPFYVIINLAIGGLFDGNPDDRTAFPQQMRIDYISVSQQAN